MVSWSMPSSKVTQIFGPADAQDLVGTQKREIPAVPDDFGVAEDALGEGDVAEVDQDGPVGGPDARDDGKFGPKVAYGAELVLLAVDDEVVCPMDAGLCQFQAGGGEVHQIHLEDGPGGEKHEILDNGALQAVDDEEVRPEAAQEAVG